MLKKKRGEIMLLFCHHPGQNVVSTSHTIQMGQPRTVLWFGGNNHATSFPPNHIKVKVNRPTFSPETLDTNLACCLREARTWLPDDCALNSALFFFFFALIWKILSPYQRYYLIILTINCISVILSLFM